MTRIRIFGAALAAALAAGPALAAKDTLTVGVVLEPPMLDPTGNAAAAIDEIVYANVFEGLTRVDDRGVVSPALAESWTVSDDSLSYDFKLHTGVTFSDGADFDCSDVKFTLERAMADDSTNPQKGKLEPIAAIDCPAPDHARITVKRPTGDMLFVLAGGDFVMMDPASVADNATNPVGTGPYVVSNWVKGDRIELARRDDYWGEKPFMAKVTFRIIPDASAAVAAMMAGDVDAFPNMPGAESRQLFVDDPRFVAVEGSTEGETILSMNNGKAPFDDLRVRRAVAHAIDRQAIIDGAMSGMGTPIGSHVAPHNPCYVDLTGTYPYDPAAARELLKEAGVAEGTKITLRLPPPGYARQGGEIVAAQLRDIGFDVAIEPVEWAQWLDQVYKQRDYDMSIVSHTEPNDIGIYARDNYYFNYDSPAFKALFKDYAETVDRHDACVKLRGLQIAQVAESPVVWLFELPKNGVWNAKLEGMWKNSPIQANDITKTRWVE